MKKLIYIFLLAAMFASCSSTSESAPEPAESALEAGREFVDACLKGNFIRAKLYMLDNVANEGLLADAEQKYRQLDRTERQQYREASIIIEQQEALDEKSTIIYYKNSYDKEARKIKVVKQGKEWLVDFAYTFNPNL